MANFELELRELRIVIPGSKDESAREPTVPLLLRNVSRLQKKS